MLLQRLVDYAGRDQTSLPFHRVRRFEWQLRIDNHGRLLSDRLERLLEPAENEKSKPRGVEHTVPVMLRSMGVAANLAADDVQYVLGWTTGTDKPGRVEQTHRAFIELTERWAASEEGRDDPVPQAIAALYHSGALSDLQPDDEATYKQGVLITVNGVHAYQAPSRSGQQKSPAERAAAPTGSAWSAARSESSTGSPGLVRIATTCCTAVRPAAAPAPPPGPVRIATTPTTGPARRASTTSTGPPGPVRIATS